MSKPTVIFPSGFKLDQDPSIKKEKKVIEIEELGEVVKLYREEAHNVRFSFDLMSKAITLGRLVFGNEPISTLRQCYVNHSCFVEFNNHNYEFLFDTIKFISVGRRNMSIPARADLMKFASSETLNSKNRVQVSPTIKRSERSAYIEKACREWVETTGGELRSSDQWMEWVSKPGGLEDLILTMIVLIGDPIETQC